ncbi:DNA-binding protein [Aeromonas sp. A35_P]|uniref:helix-turn-helix domain-containing protein n=1 Tax=Aeromonas TaxID=642 RepID=UPI000B9A4586|nr:DNA-binding protein [Aeromonas sp. A35_P]OZG40131.1 DNA-binding protein [Aeromonas sp. A35_P]
MNIEPIRTAAAYTTALARIEALLSAVPGTPEFDELDVLSTLVEVYEDRYHPIDAPDPVEAIKFRMEQMGLVKQDMVLYLGQPSRVTEVLKRQRKLSLSMIRRLNKGLGIPADVLIKDYQLIEQ